MLTFIQYITEADDFPHFTSAEHVKKHVEGKHPGVNLAFHDSGKHQPDHASLSMIDVPKEHQRKGIGSYAMRAINHYADHNNKTVTLSPEHRGHGQPSKSKLVSFYQSHGYKPNKGRHKDYRFSDSMIRTPRSLKEDDDDYRTHSGSSEIKGWMSPSGHAHLVPTHIEHKNDHHPEYLKHHGEQGDQVQDAQHKGFVRFGGNYSHVHGNHHFVHYDKNHPQGRATAIKALTYMKPHHDDPVTLSGSAGIYDRAKGKRNATAMRQLGSSSMVKASHAMELLRKGKSTAPHKPIIHEATEQQTLGRKIKAATTGDNESYKILDSHPHTKGSTWQAGGCGILAHALHKHLSGSKLVDVHNKKTGHTEHVVVHHGNHVYDADGATPAKDYLKKFGQREMKSHHDLELTPHDPKRATKSEISTHPGLVDRTYKHLEKNHIG